MSTIPENLVKIGLVVSKISLLQAIVKKEERRGKKVTAALHDKPAVEAWPAKNLHAIMEGHR